MEVLARGECCWSSGSSGFPRWFCCAWEEVKAPPPLRLCKSWVGVVKGPAWSRSNVEHEGSNLGRSSSPGKRPEEPTPTGRMRELRDSGVSRVVHRSLSTLSLTEPHGARAEQVPTFYLGPAVLAGQGLGARLNHAHYHAHLEPRPNSRRRAATARPRLLSRPQEPEPLQPAAKTPRGGKIETRKGHKGAQTQ